MSIQAIIGVTDILYGYGMNYLDLRNELTADPLARGYDVMTSAQKLNSLQVANRPSNKESLTGSEVLNAINKTEFDAKTDAQRQRVWDIVHLGTLNPFGIEAVLFTEIFGLESATITALAALRKNPDISRAEELGFNDLSVQIIDNALSGGF